MYDILTALEPLPRMFGFFFAFFLFFSFYLFIFFIIFFFFVACVWEWYSFWRYVVVFLFTQIPHFAYRA